MTEESEQISEEEIADRLASLVGTTPSPEEKQNVHTFLSNVAIAKDTTKTANLSIEELGIPVLPVRTYQELSLFCSEVANMDYFSDYLKKKGEIINATSLSKEAKLISLAVLQKREVADVSKPRKSNKGWFKRSGQETNAGVE